MSKIQEIAFAEDMAGTKGRKEMSKSKGVRKMAIMIENYIGGF